MARRGGMGATYDREGVQKSDVYHTARNLTLTLKSYIEEKKKSYLVETNPAHDQLWNHDDNNHRKKCEYH